MNKNKLFIFTVVGFLAITGIIAIAISTGLESASDTLQEGITENSDFDISSQSSVSSTEEDSDSEESSSSASEENPSSITENTTEDKTPPPSDDGWQRVLPSETVNSAETEG